MVINYSKKITLNEKFYSIDEDIDDFRKLIEDFVGDTHPDDKIESIEINEEGLVEVKLKSGEEIEIEIDWNELTIK